MSVHSNIVVPRVGLALALLIWCLAPCNAQLIQPAIVKPLSITTQSFSASGTVAGGQIANGGIITLDLQGQPTPLTYCNQVLGRAAVVKIDFNAGGILKVFRSGGGGSDFTATIRGVLEAEVTDQLLQPTWTHLADVEIEIRQNRPQGVVIYHEQQGLIQKIPFVNLVGNTTLPVAPRYNQLRIRLLPPAPPNNPGYELAGATGNNVQDELRLVLSCDVDYTVTLADLIPRAWINMYDNDVSPLAGPNPVGIVSNTLVRFDWTSQQPECLNDLNVVLGWRVEILRLYNTNKLKSSDPYDIEAVIDWNKALQLTTGSKQKNMSVTLADGEGFYVWRVRAVLGHQTSTNAYPDFGYTSETPGNGVINGRDCLYGSLNRPEGTVSVFYYQPGDAKMNRSYERTVASEIERPVIISESIAYADALGRELQQQVRPGAFENWNESGSFNGKDALVSESILDFEGRPALSTLTAPIIGQRSLLIRPLLNAVQSPSGALRNFSAEDYDATAMVGNPSTIAPSIASHVNQVSSFFSDENPNRAIANANGYPFSRVQLTSDGRTAVTSLPGQHHRMGALTKANETTLYGTPSDAELTSVFGCEAPRANNVSKVVSINADGVVSVRYVDADGLTLITCLQHASTNAEAITDDGSGALLEANSTYLQGVQATTFEEKLNNLEVVHTITGGSEIAPGVWSSSKSIVITAPTVVSVTYEPMVRMATASYGGSGLCPDFCFTCDWQTEIRATLVSPLPTEMSTGEIVSPSPSLTTLQEKERFFTCNIGPGDQRVAFDLPRAGTWVFERIVRFNGPISPLPPDFSTTRLSYLESIITSKLLPLDQLYSLLFGIAQNGTGLPEEAQLDQYKNYLVSNPSGAPLINPTLGFSECNRLPLPAVIPCPVEICQPPGNNFEDWLVQKWLMKSGLPFEQWAISNYKSAHTISDLFRRDVITNDAPAGDYGLYPLPIPVDLIPADHGVNLARGWGVFNALVATMKAQAQGTPDYSCPELWKAWRAAVEIVLQPGQTDVMTRFLELIGRRLDGYYSGGGNHQNFYNPETGFALNSWRLIDCKNSINCDGCLPNTGPPYTAEQLVRTEACMRYNSPEAKREAAFRVGLVLDNNDVPDWGSFRAKGLRNCDVRCEARRVEFDRQARALQEGILPFATINEATVYCQVEALIDECKNTCKFVFPPNFANVPAQLALEAAAHRMYGRVDLKTYNGQQCAPGYSLAAVVVPPGITALQALASFLNKWYKLEQSIISTPRCYNLARIIYNFYQESLPGQAVPQCIMANVGEWTYTEGICPTPTPQYSISVFPGIPGEFGLESDPQDNCMNCRLVFDGPSSLILNHPFPGQLNNLLDMLWGLQVPDILVDFDKKITTQDTQNDPFFFNKSVLANAERYSQGYVNWWNAYSTFMHDSSLSINGAIQLFWPLRAMDDDAFWVPQVGSQSAVLMWMKPDVVFQVGTNAPLAPPHSYRHYGEIGFLFGALGSHQPLPLFWRLDATEGNPGKVDELTMGHMSADGSSNNLRYNNNDLNDNLNRHNRMFTSKLGLFGINQLGYLTFQDKIANRTDQIGAVRFLGFNFVVQHVV